MAIQNKLSGGLFGESKEEKLWISELEGKGWTDDKGEPEKLKKWAEAQNEETVVAETQTFVWRKRWFNPLDYPAAPSEHDPRRALMSLLLNFAHPKPEIELSNALRDRLHINPVSVQEALIAYWKSAEIIVEPEASHVQAGQQLMQNIGSIDGIIKDSTVPMSEASIFQIYGNSTTAIPEKDGRIKMHGIVVDMEHMELNEAWLYEIVRTKGHAVDMMDIAVGDPFFMKNIEDVELTEPQMVEIVAAVCDEFSARFPEAEIEHDETIVTIGKPKEVIESFIKTLESTKQTVGVRIEEKKKQMSAMNDMRKSEEAIRKKERIASRSSNSDERKLLIKREVFKKLEQKLIDKYL